MVAQPEGDRPPVDPILDLLDSTREENLALYRGLQSGYFGSTKQAAFLLGADSKPILQEDNRLSKQVRRTHECVKTGSHSKQYGPVTSTKRGEDIDRVAEYIADPVKRRGLISFLPTIRGDDHPHARYRIENIILALLAARAPTNLDAREHKMILDALQLETDAGLSKLYCYLLAVLRPDVVEDYVNTGDTICARSAPRKNVTAIYTKPFWPTATAQITQASVKRTVERLCRQLTHGANLLRNNAASLLHIYMAHGNLYQIYASTCHVLRARVNDLDRPELSSRRNCVYPFMLLSELFACLHATPAVAESGEAVEARIGACLRIARMHYKSSDMVALVSHFALRYQSFGLAVEAMEMLHRQDRLLSYGWRPH
jgi:hypothetical protein